jgi:hypothetical protein
LLVAPPKVSLVSSVGDFGNNVGLVGHEVAVQDVLGSGLLVDAAAVQGVDKGALVVNAATV